jgi:isoquinoline 1-oxidoreductase beta subunit
MIANQKGEVRREDGNVTQAFKNAAKIVVAEYQCPFLSHSPMEPMNFFAHVKGDKAELIGPTQTPDRARQTAAEILGIPPENISVEITRLGGGFGRRLAADYVAEAVQISKLTNAPVKVTWNREDDLSGGLYRPAVRYRFEAALDESGNMIGYKLKGAGINSGNSTRQDNFPSGAVENLKIESLEYKSSITTNAWRAPITNFLAYAEQSFLDEVALEAGKDPVQFRLDLLDKAKNSPTGEIKYDVDRMIGVIKTAAEKSNWGKDPAVKQGFSVYFSHRTYVAQVADIGLVHRAGLHRVACKVGHAGHIHRHFAGKFVGAARAAMPQLCPCESAMPMHRVRHHPMRADVIIIPQRRKDPRRVIRIRVD